jgi:peptidoglycan/xylan/chitin deacetylase (PgdA/CDA1 family)
MKNTKTGSIILEHDGGGNRSQTVAALGIVIPELLDAGYRFRTA